MAAIHETMTFDPAPTALDDDRGRGLRAAPRRMPGFRAYFRRLFALARHSLALCQRLSRPPRRRFAGRRARLGGILCPRSWLGRLRRGQRHLRRRPLRARRRRLRLSERRAGARRARRLWQRDAQCLAATSRRRNGKGKVRAKIKARRPSRPLRLFPVPERAWRRSHAFWRRRGRAVTRATPFFKIQDPKLKASFAPLSKGWKASPPSASAGMSRFLPRAKPGPRFIWRVTRSRSNLLNGGPLTGLPVLARLRCR